MHKQFTHGQGRVYIYIHIHTKLRSDLTHWHSAGENVPNDNRSIAVGRGAARETKVSLQ